MSDTHDESPDREPNSIPGPQSPESIREAALSIAQNRLQAADGETAIEQCRSAHVHAQDEAQAAQRDAAVAARVEQLLGSRLELLEDASQLDANADTDETGDEQ